MEQTKYKILIIDSDAKFAENTALALRACGFETWTAEDGDAAVEELATLLPDLIFIDLALPDGKGMKVLNKVLHNDLNSPKMIVLGCEDAKVRAELSALDTVDFLAKSVENDVLLMTVKNALRSKTPFSEKNNPDRFTPLEKFFPFLAHEIRNPLHAIGGALTVIQKRCDLQDDVINRAVRIIQEEISHLNSFIQGCLDFVRPPLKSRLTDVDINEVIGVTINVASYIFEDMAKGVEVTKDLDLILPKIRANYEELKRVFLNLLKNSYEAVGQKGKIHIQTKFQPNPPPGSVEILISDNGVGIKEEDLKKIFTAFFTTKLRGMGLGLAICHQIIVERHRGRIAIQSEEENGTTVRIELPAGRNLQTDGVQTK